MEPVALRFRREASRWLNAAAENVGLLLPAQVSADGGGGCVGVIAWTRGDQGSGHIYQHSNYEH